MSIRSIALFVVALSLIQCSEEFTIIDCFPEQCGIPATVVNLEGQDGCGLGFQLWDNTYLIPERRTYVKSPSPDEDPIYYLDLEAGQKVKLGYKKSLAANACMAGTVVFINCITKIEEAAV